MSLFIFLLWLMSCINIFRIVILKRSGKETIGWFIFHCIIALLQFRFDGFSWQLVLLYVLPIAWIGFYKTKLKRFYSFVLVSSFTVTSLLLVAFPIPALDEPKGEYIVGTTTIYFIDEKRDREIPTQIWYPSSSNEGEIPVKWFETDALIAAFAEEFHMKPFMMSQLRHVKTHAYKDIEVAKGKHPVVLISHGFSSFRGLHITIIEELASRGYIVVVPDHTGISAMTTLHTGEIVLCDKEKLRDDQILTDAPILMNVYSEDIAFVMDRMTDLNNQNKVLYHHMDLDRIGFLGHSTGAGAQTSYLMTHDVQAFIGMDPWLEPLEEVKKLNEPTLVFRSMAWSENSNNDYLQIIVDEVIQPKRSNHQDFTDAFRFSPALSVVGYTSGKYREDINYKIISFFNEHLLKIKKNEEEILPIIEIR